MARRRNRRPPGKCLGAAARGLSAAVALGFAPSACRDDGPIGHPLSLALEAPQQARAAEAVSVRYAAAGRRLQGLVFAWGDGEVDSVVAAGAQTAAGAVEHVYEAPGGLFVLRARVEDAVEGAKTAEARILVVADPP